MSVPDQPDPRRWRALAVCLVAGFMTLLDVSIVNVALPPIQRGLGASAAELSWVVSGYALTFGLVLVPSGRLGDDRGRKKLFLIALALFTLTSAAAGAATGGTWLVVTRLLQGAAGGMLNPQVVGFIQDLFRGPERGRAFGLFGAAIGVSTAVGPLLGGLLLAWGGEAEGWRWVFYVNVPIGIVALLMGWRLLPADRRPSEHAGRAERQPLDLVGALLLGAAVVALMLPLVLAEQDAAGAPWWLLAVFAALLVAFAFWERGARRRHGHPLVDFALLRTRSYALGSTLGLLYFAGFTSIFFVLTIFLQQGRSYSPLAAGLALTPFAVGSSVSSAVSGRLVARLGKPLVVIGLVLVAAGLIATDLVLRAAPAQVGWAIALPLLVAGAGSGLVIAPNQTLALSEIPPREGGTAAGVLQTGQRVGSAIGIAAVGAVFFGRLSADRDVDAAISAGLLVTIGLVVLALAVGTADLVLDRVRGRRRARAVARPSATAAGPTMAPGVDGSAPHPAHPEVALHDDGAHGLPAHDLSASTLAGRSEVAGRVCDGAGDGVAAAMLTLVDAAGRQAARATADASGSFLLAAPGPGTYQLVVRAPDHPPVVSWLRVAGAGTVHDVALPVGHTAGRGAPNAD